MFFQKIEDAAVIIRRNGIEQQCAIYRRGEYLFAEVGRNRYLRLYHDGSTTLKNISIVAYDLPFEVTKDSLGRMIPDAAAITGPAQAKGITHESETN